MIRFATIGTNFIVRKFLEAAAKSSELLYIASYSRDEEKAKAFAAEYSACRYCTDLMGLANSKDVDAVYIASPNSLHFEQSILMLSHGKHVLCEKTITSNQLELDKLIETADKNHVVLLEAMRSVFDPGFAVIQDNLHRLGLIRRVSFQFCKYSSRYDNFKKGVIENSFNPLFSNGALMDIGVYCIHPLVKLFGLPNKIISDAIFLHNGVDGAGTILARYEQMQAELIYSKISDSHIPSQIQGEDGTLVIEEIPNPCKITFYGKNGETEVLMSREPESNMIYEIKEWIGQIKGERDWHESMRSSRMELQMMDEVRRQLSIKFPADEEEQW
ncbi:Gfo/Idh/MocA family oxidoreductase [Clostridium sp. E02]|uniref:Gfo/Idh/MocA family protein n=1 Tax=Clostridium sp. E02 TaxID=2487134 RepID=UPI000F536763|nr:Gfo/Idh/MocA family oxidoreductase [Clostridium sp. E02]